MANGSVTSFLSAEGAVLTDPGELERALAFMWKQAGESATVGESKAAVSRVSLANLVVVGPADARDAPLQILGELAPQYPTRSIVLLINSAAPPQHQQVLASVSALCHLPRPGEPQVCAEQILLRCGPDQGDLDRTVLPLLEGDIPLMVWWTLDPGLCRPLRSTLLQHATRFICDAGPAGVAHLGELNSEAASCVVRDLGWYRIGRWRELLAGCFDTPPQQQFLRAVQRVRIEHAATVTGTVDAIWLAAFLAGQLDWRKPTFSDGIFRMRSEAQAIEVALAATRTEQEGIVSLTLAASEATFQASRRDGQLHIVEPHGQARSTSLPHLSCSQALADGLVGRHIDLAFERASLPARTIAAFVSRGSV